MARLGRWLARHKRTSAAVLTATAAVTALLAAPALGIDWKSDDDGNVASQYNGTSWNSAGQSETDCPTFTSTPPSYDVFFNMPDMDVRGFGDANSNESWNFSRRIAQIVCGAKEGATVNIGMFFIRALGTVERYESDPEEIWKAVEYVAKRRNVEVNMVLDGGGITSKLGKQQIKARLGDFVNIKWCTNGCLEANSSSKVLPNSINHEKFITISDTIWPNATAGPHPAVYSSSANISRGQTRNYMADGSLIYDDLTLYELLVNRFKGMQFCSAEGADEPTETKDGKACDLNALKTYSGQNSLADGKKHGGSYPNVWVDTIYRHFTDNGRGTTISFSPQPQDARDYFTKMFDDVDCKVDGEVRVGMFRLSDSRAKQFADAAKRLKSRGCDVKILLSPKGGMATITKATKALLDKAKIPLSCSNIPLHTKYVLVGSRKNNEGRVLFGTANMSTSGLRYSDEHMLLVDTRRTSGEFKADARRFYAKFVAGWNEMNQESTTCKPSK